MAYHAVPGTPLQGSSSAHSLEECGEETCCKVRSDGRRVTTRSLLGINTVLLVFQVALLIAHIAIGWQSSGETFILETYGFDTKYMTLAHDYDWLWEDRAVQRAGAIAVQRDANGDVTEYGVISITRFHQLHCVASLRKALQEAYEGGDVAFNQNEDPHWPHCLHYLHQMITCKADGQIEKQQIWNVTTPFVSGAEDFRQCQDSQVLFELFKKEGV